MRSEAHKIKKAKQHKNKHPKEGFMESIFTIYTDEGSRGVLCLREEGKWARLSSWAFYPEERGRIDLVLSRGQCARLLLQLQHQSWWQSLGIREKTRRKKGGRTLQTKRKNTKS